MTMKKGDAKVTTLDHLAGAFRRVRSDICDAATNQKPEKRSLAASASWSGAADADDACAVHPPPSAATDPTVPGSVTSGSGPISPSDLSPHHAGKSGHGGSPSRPSRLGAFAKARSGNGGPRSTKLKGKGRIGKGGGGGGGSVFRGRGRNRAKTDRRETPLRVGSCDGRIETEMSTRSPSGVTPEDDGGVGSEEGAGETKKCSSIDSSEARPGGGDNFRQQDSGDSDAAEDAAWGELQQDSSAPAEVALCSLHIPSVPDVDAFWDTFLADDAPHPMESYQRDVIGDLEIASTPWHSAEEGGEEGVEENDDNDGDSQRRHAHTAAVHDTTRTLTFRHPLPKYGWAPGPSHAGTTRIQRRRRFGRRGICVDTATYVTGVPSASCFHVADRWTVEPYCGNDGGGGGNRADGENDCGGGDFNGGIVLTARFECCFTRRTILRRFIEPSTRTEVKEWFGGYATFVRNMSSGGGCGTPDPPVVEQQKELLASMSVSMKSTSDGGAHNNAPSRTCRGKEENDEQKERGVEVVNLVTRPAARRGMPVLEWGWLLHDQQHTAVLFAVVALILHIRSLQLRLQMLEDEVFLLREQHAAQV